MPKSELDLEPNQDLNEADDEPVSLPEKRSKDAAWKETLTISSLPNYQNDRRSDLRAASEYVGTVPATRDYERKIKALAGAGSYRVEYRQGGRVVKYWVVEIEPDVRVVGAEQSAQATQPAADGVAARLDRIERALLDRELPESEPVGYRPRLRRHVVRRVREPEPKPEPTMAELYRESLSRERALLQQFLQFSLQPRRESKEKEPDDEFKALKCILDNPSIRGRIQSAVGDLVDATPPDWKTELVRGVLENGEQIFPALQMILAQRVGAVQPMNGYARTNGHAPPAQPAQPMAVHMPANGNGAHVGSHPAADAPGQGEETAEDQGVPAISEALLNAIVDLLANEPPDESAKEIARVVEDEPAVEGLLNAYLAQTPAQLLQAFSQIAFHFQVEGAERVAGLDYGVAWIERLKALVQQRREAGKALV